MISLRANSLVPGYPATNRLLALITPISLDLNPLCAENNSGCEETLPTAVINLIFLSSMVTILLINELMLANVIIICYTFFINGL